MPSKDIKASFIEPMLLLRTYQRFHVGQSVLEIDVSYRPLLFRTIGIVLLVALAAWIILSLIGGIGRPQPQVVERGPAFEGNVQLPKEQIQQAVGQARDKMNRRYSYSEWARYAATF